MNTKILFITHHFLHGTGGGCFASRAYINAFAELFGDVALLYPFKKDMEAQYINPTVKIIPVSYDKHRILKLLDLIMGRVHRYYNISRLIGQEKFDLVVFDNSLVSFRLIDYFKRQGSKTIVIHHNYQYEYFRDNTPFPVNIPTLYWCKRFEGEAVRKASLNLTLTNQDILLLKSHYAIGSERFERLGVFEYKSNEHNNVITHAKNYSTTFAITGTLSSYQTYQSLNKWFNVYFPIFNEEFPHSKLIIAGRNPSEELRNIASSKANVEIVPNPASMDNILNKVDYYICPTELGGGLKLRIMDGLSHGLPVVTHKVSARGYDEIAAKGYLFSYDSPESFRDCLKKLKTLEVKQDDIIDAYRSIFSFDAGVIRLKTILSTL